MQFGCLLTGLLLEVNMLWYSDYLCLFKAILGFIMVGSYLYPKIMKIQSISYKLNSFYQLSVFIGLLTQIPYFIAMYINLKN